MFESFLIVVFESLNSLQFEKMDLKITHAGELKNLKDLEDFSEEQSSV